MIAFEPYAKADREECLGLFNSNLPKFFAPNELEDFKEYLDHSIEQYWCMREAGVLIGAGGIRVREDNVGRLCWGIIRNDKHRKGYGRQLLMFRLKQLAMLSHVSKIQLETSQYNPEFFHRFGFTEITKTENLYGPGWHSHEMELVLTPEVRKLLL